MHYARLARRRPIERRFDGERDQCFRPLQVQVRPRSDRNAGSIEIRKDINRKVVIIHSHHRP